MQKTGGHCSALALRFLSVSLSLSLKIHKTKQNTGGTLVTLLELDYKSGPSFRRDTYQEKKNAVTAYIIVFYICFPL